MTLLDFVSAHLRVHRNHFFFCTDCSVFVFSLFVWQKIPLARLFCILLNNNKLVLYLTVYVCVFLSTITTHYKICVLNIYIQISHNNYFRFCAAQSLYGCISFIFPIYFYIFISIIHFFFYKILCC